MLPISGQTQIKVVFWLADIGRHDCFTTGSVDNSSKHGGLPAKTRTEAIHMGGVHQQQ